MTDPLHAKIVDEALTNLTNEIEVKMTGGELFLYHTLLQDYGIDFVGYRLIPLLKRNKARLDKVTP